MKRKYFAYPYIVWMILFIVVPMLFIFYYAFNVNGEWTFRKCWETLTDGQKWRVLLISVEIAFGTTAICLLLGYPIAYILSNMKKTVAGSRGLCRGAAGNPRFPRLLPGTLGNFPGCL